MPALAQPPRIDPTELFALAPAISRDVALATARDAIVHGVFRPADAEQALIGEPLLAYVPLWSVQLGGKLTDLKGGGSGTAKKEFELVLGRRGIPWDPSGKARIEPGTLIPAHSHAFDDGEVIAPDVTRREAEQEASQRVRQRLHDAHDHKARSEARGQSSWSTFASTETSVESAVLCHYPLWLVGYRRADDELFFVGVSATSGTVVCARHPSAIRAVADKIGRVMGKLFR